jgi:multiple sugar transport system substrate-binding protein
VNEMQKKKSTLLVMVTAIATILAACSGGNSAPIPTASQPAANEETPAPTEAAEEPKEVNLNGREIRISNWWDATPASDSEADELARERIKAVEEKYNVKISYVNTEYGVTSEKISSTVLANDPFAEIVRVPDGDIWGLMQGGFLTPLDDYLKNTKIAPEVIDSMRFGGDKIYGLMGWYTPNDNGMFYNKRIFKEAGIKDPQQLMEEDNWNWNTMLDAAKKLTVDTNGDGKMDQYGLSGAYYVFHEMLIPSNGGKLYDEATQKAAFDSPQAMEALNFLYSLYNEHKVIKANEGNDWEDPSKYFSEGNIAMYPGGLWEVEGRIQGKLKDDWGYVYMPKGPQATAYLDVVNSTESFVIPKGVKDADIVVKIWEELQDFDNWKQNHRLWLETILPDEASIANAMDDNGKVIRVTDARAGGLGVKNILGSVTEKFVKGEVTPSTGVAQVIDSAQAGIQKVLRGEPDKKE